MKLSHPFRTPGTVGLAAIFVVVVCLTILAIDVTRTYNARALELKQGEVAVENLARSMAQQANDTLQQSDAVLIGLVDRVESNGVDAASLDRIHALLIRYANAMPQFQRLTVTDESGQWLTTSLPTRSNAISVKDRSYFKHHRDTADANAFIGPVIRSRSSNQWILTLSRRIDHADGRFAGVALASIDLAHFDRFFGQFDVGPHGALALASTDGMLIDRRPFVDAVIGTDQSATPLFRDHASHEKQGILTTVSALDGVERLIAFRQLDDYPVIVFAALSTDDILAEWRATAITHTIFVVVLVLTLGLIGFVLVRQVRSKSFVEEQLRTSQAALETKNVQLSAIATKDGLTGLANRRELDRVLTDEMSRAYRSRGPLTVIMLDVDHFKAFNDRYGHLAGDDCLRGVADALAEHVRRPGDFLARFGGEEFVAVLPGVDTVGAATVAEAFCASVRNLQIVHAGSPKGMVSISAGVAVWSIDSVEVSMAALLHTADSALYHAKRNGRDRVGWNRPTPLPVPSSPPTRESVDEVESVG